MKKRLEKIIAMGLIVLLVCMSFSETAFAGINFSDADELGLNTTYEMKSMEYYFLLPEVSGNYNMQFRFASYCDAKITLYDSDYNKLDYWNPCLSSGSIDYSVHLDAGERYYLYYKGTRSNIDVTITLEQKDESVSSEPSEPDVTISSVQEWKEFAEDVNAGNSYKGKLVQLTKDLDFGASDVNNYTTPIGNKYGYSFEGIFDGGNHCIRGVSFINNNKKISSVALFGKIGSSGQVRNLILEEFDLEGYGFIGGVAVSNKGTIKNVILRNSKLIGNEETSEIGGIVSKNEGIIDNCHLENTMLANCFQIGGIVGTVYSGTVKNCSVDGTIQGIVCDGDGIIGGIACINWGNIYNCCNKANMNFAKEEGEIGGISCIVAEDAIVKNCYNAGKITAEKVGGIASTVDKECIVANCYSLEGAAPALFMEIDGVNKNNEILSKEEMTKPEFAEQLNQNRGSNTDWLLWEYRADGEYPVLAGFKNIGDCQINMDQTSIVYTGEKIEPSVTVTMDGVLLEKETDYSVTYEENENAGTATVVISGCGRYVGTAKKTFTISPKDISGANIDVDSCIYNGKEQKPDMVVKIGNTVLTIGKDYVFSRKNNKNVGTGIVTVTGKGNYTGNASAGFKIKKANQKITYTKAYQKAYNAKPFTLYVKHVKGDGKITYKSSNSKVATVNSKGKVTIKKAGKAVITVTAASTKNYNKATVKVTVQVLKKKEKLERKGAFCKSGEYWYYSFDNSGIVRVNTKGKKKKIVGIKIGKSQGLSFSNLNVKGNYIYAQWNKIDSETEPYNKSFYIYRISKDGKKVKRLAQGCMPVVVGNSIYYVKTVYDKTNGCDTVTNVIMKMKLDGSAKKVAKRVSGNVEIAGMHRCENRLVYSVSDNKAYYELSGKKLNMKRVVLTGNISAEDNVTTGGYKYYTSGQQKNMYRKNIKTGKKTKIFTLNTKAPYTEKIISYYVSGSYTMVETFYTHMAFQIDDTKVYMIKNNGASKKKLGKYMQGYLSLK